MTTPARDDWDAVIGPGFTEALQQGLARSARQAGSGPRAARTAARRSLPAEPLDAVLRRFEAALPALPALSGPDHGDDSLPESLMTQVRAVLLSALDAYAGELRDGVAEAIATARLLLEECDALPDPATRDRLAAARHSLRQADARLHALTGAVHAHLTP
ncbi:hypothetical protein [Streptomyces xanthophaeus]|uniref:hypothetical protein n=1 Tax=Streptomyces xanthophaeus TaxID=67385 RepID=UPI002649DCE4|nr:hypothetical protein [Streptomyces xanthophaeus]WKD32057.1 hypothetical protein KO717_08915 [Streptomyces xanthophaeus]